MYQLRYIGEDREHSIPFPNGKTTTIKLEHNKVYAIDLQPEFPMTIINGEPIIPLDGTVWLCFVEHGGLRLPYSMEAAQKQWRLPDVNME